MKKSNLLRHLIFLAAAAFIVVAFVNTQYGDCRTSTSRVTVKGNSLSGVLENGETIIIRSGYYNCNEVERGDIVTFDYPGRSAPLVKIVRAVPGDSWQIIPEGDKYNIAVNEWILRNSELEPYLIDERAKNLLSLYIRDYDGVIPKNTYLLLGNEVSGSLDSTRFGLVSRNDLKGRVFSY